MAEKWWKYPWQMPSIGALGDLPPLHLIPEGQDYFSYVYGDNPDPEPETISELTESKIGDKVKRGETPGLF